MKRCKECGELKPLDEFYRARGMRDGHRNDCKVCNLAAKAARTAENPQANRDRVRRWQVENADRYRATQREYAKSGRKRLVDRKSYLKRTYGLMLEDYERLLEVQGGVCAICREPRPEERTLHVDHNHDTGEIRGLLCFRCNNALGDMRESADFAQALLDYLDRDDELAALARERLEALSA
jgi:hypothetical protein